MKNVIFGYARVSTKEQNEERQLKALREAGVEERYIAVDKSSGKDFNRKEYQRLIADRLGEGDTLVICSIDRLGRNYSEIQEQWRYITQTLKADIRVLDMPLLDTSKDNKSLDNRFIADLALQILSYVADKERVNIRRRQQQGIDAMPIINGKKVSGKTNKPMGRPKAEYPPNWNIVYTEWKSGNITAKSAMQQLNLKVNTFYKLANQYAENTK